MAKSGHPGAVGDGVKRRRNGDEHIDNCKTGYDWNKERDERYVQIHHIVCITCLSPGTIEGLNKKHSAYIEKCMKTTEWNINDGKNVLGLPKKRVYFDRPKNRWAILPCHDVDHPMFTDEVNGFLRENLWDQLDAAEEDCEVEGESIGLQLAITSEYFRGELEIRGMRAGGTALCWVNRDKMPDTWYLPFSMAQIPAPRRHPPEKKGGSWETFRDAFWSSPKKK